jgi:hypothetical protein
MVAALNSRLESNKEEERSSAPPDRRVNIRLHGKCSAPPIGG